MKHTPFYVLGPSLCHTWAEKFCKDIGAKMAIVKDNNIVNKINTDTADMILNKDMMVWNGYNDIEKVRLT